MISVALLLYRGLRLALSECKQWRSLRFDRVLNYNYTLSKPLVSVERHCRKTKTISVALHLHPGLGLALPESEQWRSLSTIRFGQRYLNVLTACLKAFFSV